MDNDFWIRKNTNSTETDQSINTWDYMKIQFLLVNGNSQQSTQTPPEWETICTSDTLNSSSYLEFTENYTN